jgi:hypothetical protein
MPLELPRLRDVPGLCDALRWLLGHRSGATSDRNMLVKARLCGLITSNSQVNWRADGRVTNRLAAAALRRLPRDPQELGRILYGLGEINARGTTELTLLLTRHLARRSPRLSFLKALDGAAAFDSKRSTKPRLSAIDFAQWISGAPLAWHTFDRAVHRIGHPDFSIGGGRYGLRFAAQIITVIDPRAIDVWIALHPNRQRVAAIGSTALPTDFDSNMLTRASLLLRSRIPAIKCLAAALHVCPIFPTPSLANFRDCRQALVDGGIDPRDAAWMTAYRIKGAVHALNWAQHQLEGNQARLRSLEANPDAAMGGRHNFDAEMHTLRAQIQRSTQRLSELGPELEGMLSDLAADWPPDGLSEDQMKSLDCNFVATPEIRHRLAEKLSHRGNHDWLLKRNIAQLCTIIGLSREPSPIFDVHFNADDLQLDRVIPWTAQSLILLYADDRRGVGKKTSDLVVGMTEAFELLAAQPFAAARAPMRFQSALARAACAHLFGLMVVACTLEAGRANVKILNKLAIEHVLTLLCARGSDARSSQLLFRLTVRTVLQMSFDTYGEKLRRQWVAAEELPAFARALALWSSPALVEENKTLAAALFRRTAEPPLSRRARGIQVSQMLTLLDLAISASIQIGRGDLVCALIELWAEVYKDWQPFFPQWASAAETMAAAVERDGPERQVFLADTAFAQTHCRRLIEAMA